MGETTGEPGTNDPGFQVRHVTPEDMPAICSLFGKVFDDEMSEELWHWKYDREQSRAVVVYQDNELVAHYGGVGTDILIEGKPGTAIQVTDLMVDPGARNTVRSRSPFYLSAKKFLEDFAGYDKPFLLGYGFPSDRAMGLSEKLHLFAPVGRMWESRWADNGDHGKTGGKVILLDRENFSRYEKAINKLWQTFSSNFSSHIICCKDADYFRWRFLEHPSKNYSLYLIQAGFLRQPQALLVLRHDQESSMLMDILVHNMDLENAISLASGIAAEEGNSTLVTWCSDVFREKFAVCDAEQKPLEVIIPANIGSQGPAPDSQKNKWWFMPGDTDYL